LYFSRPIVDFESAKPIVECSMP